MEDIFTNAQVLGYSVIPFRKIVLILLSNLIGFSVFAQASFSTDNKKAIKYFERGIEEAKARNFRLAMDLFNESINKDPYFQEPYLKLASIYNLYQHKDSALLYYNGYVSITPKEKVNPKIWRTLATLQFDFGNYTKSEAALENYLYVQPEMAIDPEIEYLRESIRFALNAIKTHIPNEIILLPPEVNRWQLQYFPVLTGDGRTLIYTKRNSNNAYSDEDLVFSVLSDSGWTEAKSISGLINSKLNEGAGTISADGRILIFTSCDGNQSYGSCDLYISRKVGESWSKPENLGPNVNTDRWESQPSLSADGRTLYYSSNRPGGYGQRDIWVTKFNGVMWSLPKNLGSEINTSQEETTPFIHANNQTLFFASNGRVGMGGFDIYFSEKVAGKWDLPKNIGFPYNTFRDEYAFFISSSGNQAFYSKEVTQPERTAIVYFNLTEDTLIKRKTSYVMGLVLDKETNKPLRASISMENVQDSTDVYFVESDSISGTYFLTLTEGNEYAVFASKRNYLFEDFNYTTKQDLLLPDTIHIYLQPLRPGGSVVLENIYFDFDKYDLKPESEAELKAVSEYIKQENTLKFLIEGHTDNLGSKEYNLNLSELRAKSVYHYLINLGVNPSQLKYQGFGSLVPIATNETVEGQKLNRRIAFRVSR